MLVKIHKSYRDVVAICDKELMGKSFEKGNAILEVKENFYNGDEVDEKKALSIMQFHIKEDATFNIVGKKINCPSSQNRNYFKRRNKNNSGNSLCIGVDVIIQHYTFASPHYQLLLQT